MNNSLIYKEYKFSLKEKNSSIKLVDTPVDLAVKDLINSDTDLGLSFGKNDLDRINYVLKHLDIDNQLTIETKYYAKGKGHLGPYEIKITLVQSEKSDVNEAKQAIAKFDNFINPYISQVYQMEEKFINDGQERQSTNANREQTFGYKVIIGSILLVLLICFLIWLLEM